MTRDRMRAACVLARRGSGAVKRLVALVSGERSREHCAIGCKAQDRLGWSGSRADGSGVALACTAARLSHKTRGRRVRKRERAPADDCSSTAVALSWKSLPETLCSAGVRPRREAWHSGFDSSALKVHR